MENIMGSVLKHSIFQMLLMNLLFASPVLKAGEKYDSTTKYCFYLKVNNESERYIEINMIMWNQSNYAKV